MRREEQQNAMDGFTEANDVPIDLTKKADPTPKPVNHTEIPENKTSPEWQVPAFYQPVFFLGGGDQTFRGIPTVAMANPFLLPYYPLLYEQLSLRYAMLRANPGLEGVVPNHCLYRAASDTYLKDHVQQNKVRGVYYGDNACRKNNSEASQVDSQSAAEGGHNSLRKCKSLGTLSSRTKEEVLSNHSLSCPDIQLSLNYSQTELDRPRDKRMKMDFPFSMVKNHSREVKLNHGRQDIFDLSAESRSQSMPSVSQGDQETFLQKLRHVAPAGYPCNVYGYYTELMQKYQDHEELKRRVGIEVEQSPPSSPGPEASKRRPTRTLTGKHVRHGTGASPSTLLTLRQMIQKRQRAKELGQVNGISTKCKVTKKHSSKNSRRAT